MNLQVTSADWLCAMPDLSALLELDHVPDLKEVPVESNWIVYYTILRYGMLQRYKAYPKKRRPLYVIFSLRKKEKTMKIKERKPSTPRLARPRSLTPTEALDV